MLDKILDFHPQIEGENKALGREPSLREMIRSYYVNGFSMSRGSEGNKDFNMRVDWYVNHYIENLKKEFE